MTVSVSVGWRADWFVGVVVSSVLTDAVVADVLLSS